MTTRLIIARHGNTFEDGETPRRIGRRTDLPLTAKGQAQAEAIGHYLRAELLPTIAFCGHLQRTRETARLALEAAGLTMTPQVEGLFDEIDHGPDENAMDEDIKNRIGTQALQDWDTQAIVPPGWLADPTQIIAGWLDFGARLARDYSGQTILAVTSNGVARFAPYLTGNFAAFSQRHNLKLATGAIAEFVFDGNRWTARHWNLKPAPDSAPPPGA